MARLSAVCVFVYVVNVGLRISLAVTFPLLYKEASFWEWSQFPQTGYLRHPPLVTWIIHFFTWAFSDDSRTVLRLGSVILGAVSFLQIRSLAARLFGDPDVANWSLLIAISLPVVSCVGIVMLPDAPLLFFHLLFLNLFVTALQQGSQKSWLLAGVALGLALLSKLMAVLTVPAIVLFLLWSPTYRHWLRRKEPYGALAVALFVFSPFLYWNYTNEWATFRFQLWSRHEPSFAFSKLLEVAFEQLLDSTPFMLIPVLGVLCISSSRLPAKWREGYVLLKIQSLSVLIFFLAAGSVTETHPHWTLLAYPSAAIALAAFYVSCPSHFLNRPLRILTTTSLSVLTLLACVVIVSIGSLKDLDPARLGPSFGKRVAKAQQTLFGWQELGPALNRRLEESFDNETSLLFTDTDYTGIVAYHSGSQPVVNLHGLTDGEESTNNSQRYYIDLRTLVGRSGIFFSEKQRPTEQILREWFEEIEELEPIQFRYQERVIVYYRVFRVANFKSSQNR